MAFVKKYLLPILVLFLAYYYSTKEEFRPGKYQCVSFGGAGLKHGGGGGGVLECSYKTSYALDP